MATFTDSVAVAVVDDGILQGVGNKLIHRSVGGESREVCYDFKFRDKIHGIETFRDGDYWKICVYGGRYLAICELLPKEENTDKIKLISKCRLTDVISSAKICPGDYRILDLITTYNVALRMRLNEDNKWEVVRKSVCEERSTLYCSHISYEEESGEWCKMRLFGGTALGEVVFWRPEESGKSRISYRFSTPRGVLFSITTNPGCSQLFTTSDDRSVRFCTLIWDAKDRVLREHDLRLACFGHMGRVFRSVLTEYGGIKYLISVGEDCRVCCWDMDGNMVFRRDIHSGASLWNVTVVNDLIYTTTSNGSLEVIDFRQALQKTVLGCVGKDLFIGDYPAKIRFLSSDKIVCVTNRDELKLLSYSGDCWRVSFALQLPFKSTVLQVFADLIVLGGFSHVSIFKHRGDNLELQSESKEAMSSLVRAIHWMPNSDNLLVVNDRGEGVLVNHSLVVQKRINLNSSQGKERWSTSVLMFNEYLIVADRHGSLHSFDCRSEGIDAPLVCALRRVHGSLGITGMCQVNERCFLTTGHDGFIRTIHLGGSSGMMEVWRSQRVPIKWIERLDGDLVIGFNDQHFTIWHRLERRIVLELDCGGGHRFWDFVQNGDQGRFIYIKNRRLRVANVVLSSQRSVLSNSLSYWHTMSTNCLKLWSVGGTMFVLSGGEEGLVKIHEFVGDSLVYRDELTAHIANIRSMDVRVLDDASCLLFTGGGRAQLCVHRLEWSGRVLEVRECSNYMLKCSDLKRRRKGTNQSVGFDPETRLMSLFVDGDTIYVGCSDGFIRVFRYEDGEIVLREEKFYGKCILQIGRIVLDTGSMFILTMATDGQLNFWAQGSFEEPVFTMAHHDSGINAFDVGRVEGDGDTYWVVTGGDDQGIVGSRIKIGVENGVGMSIESTFIHSFRHTAQVSGIQILSGGRFLSVAVDQEVFEHKLGEHEEYKNVSFTSVSDAKGLVMVDERRMLIYGAGVEILELV